MMQHYMLHDLTLLHTIGLRTLVKRLCQAGSASQQMARTKAVVQCMLHEEWEGSELPAAAAAVPWVTAAVGILHAPFVPNCSLQHDGWLLKAG
jgi:hypothetical protein